MVLSNVRPPRPLQARALETRGALLDAALECLVERGYAATTTIETARRAGLSRGAQLHHFPTKADLLTAAVGRLLDRRLAEFQKAFADVPPGVDRKEAAIDVLWSMFEGPSFVAWAELWMAARTDPALAVVVTQLDRHFAEECKAIHAELFPAESGVDGVARDFTFALMDGLAFQRLISPDERRPASEYLHILKAMAMTSGPQPSEENP